jgi:hypothetical protein
VPRRFTLFPIGWLDRRWFSEAFHQHPAALAIGEQAGPWLCGRTLLLPLRVPPTAAKFPA